MGIDANKYKDWDSYPAVVNEVELCVMLPKGLTLEKAATFSEDKAARHVIVLSKAKSNWKCIWPQAEQLTKAA